MNAARIAVVLPALAVAAGAVVATAHGLFAVADAAKVPEAISWLYPLITDGLALVAYAATHQLPGNKRYAWSVVVLAALLSGLAQAVYLAGGATVQVSPPLAFGIGAWPAIAAAIVAHLVYLLLKPTPEPQSGQLPAVPSADAAPTGLPAEPDEESHEPVIVIEHVTAVEAARSAPVLTLAKRPESDMEKAQRLLREKAGRPALMSELQITDGMAKQLKANPERLTADLLADYQARAKERQRA